MDSWNIYRWEAVNRLAISPSGIIHSIALHNHKKCIHFSHVLLFILLHSSRTLAQHCHNIERLDLSDCKKITDQAIYAISKHCAKLSNINLESCVNITDKSLKNLADGCPVIHWLHCFCIFCALVAISFAFVNVVRTNFPTRYSSLCAPGIFRCCGCRACSRSIYRGAIRSPKMVSRRWRAAAINCVASAAKDANKSTIMLYCA